MKRAKRTGGVSDVDVVFWAHCVRCGRLLIGIASTRVGSVRVRLEERPATGRCCPGTWLIWLSDWSGFISFSTMLTVVSIFTASIVEILFSLLVLTSPDSRVSAVVAASNRSLPAPLLPPDDALPAFSHIQPRGEGDDDDERPSRTNPPPPRACASTSSSANQPAATEQQRHQGRGKSARTLSWPCLSKGGQSLVPLRTPQSTYVHHCCTPSDGGGGGGEYTCRHGHGEGAGVAGGVPWPARDKRPWLWAWRRGGGRAERSLIAHRVRVTGPSQRRARHLRRCDAQGTCGGDFTARP